MYMQTIMLGQQVPEGGLCDIASWHSGTGRKNQVR